MTKTTDGGAGGSVTDYRLEGDLDLQTAPGMIEALVDHAATLGSESPEHLVLDCERLHFIDSTGLSALEAVQRKTGRRIVLRNLAPMCRRVFEITQLDRLFLIEGAPAEHT